jgi:uncharacterized protein YecE (DUF72 family)
MSVYIGTSGWNYKHWKERFYPAGLRQKDWFVFLAERFNTVEVNTSFYRIPKREVVEHWADIAPVDFKFAVKLWRGITHYKKLLNSGVYVENFLEVVEALPQRMRAPILIQLPPNQGKDVEKLRTFLHEFHQIAGKGWRVAVEFRNPEWLSDDVYDVLNKASAAICLHDMEGRAATDRENDAPFVYVRRHGSGAGRYAGSYSAQQIASDAERIRAWAKAGKDVYVYYNNDIGGCAVMDGKALREAVGV